MDETVITKYGDDELVLTENGMWVLRTGGWLPVAIAQVGNQGTWTITAPPVEPFEEATEADAVQMIWCLALEPTP